MLIKTLAFSLLALAAGTTAQATTVLDNLSMTGNPSGVQPLSSTHLSIGEAFTVGTATTSLVVADVVFPQIGGTSDLYYRGETLTLDLVTPVTGTLVPQTTTFTLDNNTSLLYADPALNGKADPGFGQTTAIPNGTMTLLPSSTYMLVLSGASNVTWDYLPNTSGYAQALGYSIPASNTSSVSDGGATTYYSIGSGPQQFVLDVIPEPSTYCLMAVAGLALVVSRKRSIKVA